MIVDKIVYDDPVCVAARNDGKTVVTGLWVDHNFDIEMPVDATSLMYKPFCGLKGILGTKGLVICLTRYQRQDRDDIMVLISLYSCGAAFIACKSNILCFLFFCIITKMLCNFTYLFADNG